MAGINISFAGNSLQTANILTSDIDINSVPNKTVSLYTLSHSNKSAIPYTEYSNKTINIGGIIYGSSITDLDSRLDTFRSYFTGQDQNLDIDYNGSTRRFIATVNSLSIQRPGGLTYANFTIDFICTQPFGQDTGTTSLLSASGRTSASYSDSLTVAGIAPFQLPIITITFSAIGSSPVAGTVSVGNGGTGQTITVTRTWTSTDVLVIDCTQNAVTINTAAADFSGAFPDLMPGAATLTYSDTFASRTFAIAVVYFKSYL